MVDRCKWANNNELMKIYHDEEWGVPIHDDVNLFEQLILQGAQAGLSWITILKKRENYRKAFDNFNFEKIASYDEKKVQELLTNKGIIRNELKIRSVINNAKNFIKIRKEFGSFNNYIWKYVNYSPLQNDWKSLDEIPSKTLLSEKISKEMKKRGFKFIGPTIIYAYMQAVGMVNDHLTYCFRYPQIKNMK
ncbi:MAG: DNA-3-methyladenine glycosylase I [Promethearchaeati archaeon]